MTGETIKSFLVSLGFDVDDGSLSKFNASIVSATKRIVGLKAAIDLSAAGVVYGIAKISQSFEDLGYEYRLIIPAINKTIALRREMLRAYQAAGINLQKVVLQSVKLNFSLAKTKFAFEAIYKGVASKFFPLITKQSDLFRAKIYANMPRIQAALERFVIFIFKALDATTQLALRVWSILGRVYDFFYKLHKATDGWSTIILGIAAAWKILNLSFLATPLGLVLSGLLAILALYDDFKVWQEGGKAFFNWTSFVPSAKAFEQVLDNIMGYLNSIAAFFHSDPDKTFFSKVTDYLKEFLSLINSVVNAFDKLGTFAFVKAANALGFNLKDPNLQTNLSTGLQPQPLGAVSNQSNQTNQHVQQQTTINVTGSANAAATGAAVASEQSRVNFDLTRNLQGAAR